MDALPDGLEDWREVTVFGGGTLIFDEYGQLKYRIAKHLFRTEADRARQARRLHARLPPTPQPLSRPRPSRWLARRPPSATSSQTRSAKRSRGVVAAVVTPSWDEARCAGRYGAIGAEMGEGSGCAVAARLGVLWARGGVRRAFEGILFEREAC